MIWKIFRWEIGRVKVLSPHAPSFFILPPSRRSDSLHTSSYSRTVVHIIPSSFISPHLLRRPLYLAKDVEQGKSRTSMWWVVSDRFIHPWSDSEGRTRPDTRPQVTAIANRTLTSESITDWWMDQWTDQPRDKPSFTVTSSRLKKWRENAKERTKNKEWNKKWIKKGKKKGNKASFF